MRGRGAAQSARVAAFVSVALVALTVPAGPLYTAEPDTARIAGYVRSQMRMTGTPGVAIAVVQDGRIVYEAGFGRAGRGRGVGPETPFVLGSVSKPVTSLAVMLLVEAGRLELDAPVARYLPEFRIGGDDTALRITIRHLLQHRSGIPRRAGFQHFDRDAPAPVRYNGAKLRSEPGTVFEYSNLNYVLLGRVVEEVTSEPFGDFLRHSVLVPAEMTSAFTRRQEAEHAGLATGHAFLGAVPVPWREPAYGRAAVPAGFVIASARDMARFLAVQMAAPGTPELLSRENLSALHRPAADETYGYAMGWRVVRWNEDERLIAHDGLTGRYGAAIGFLPDRSIGVVVLTNANAGVLGRPTATELMVGTLRIAQGDDARAGWPVERILRTGIALMLVLGVVGFVGRLGTWNREGRPRALPPLRHLAASASGGVIALLVLLLLPAWFGIPVRTLLRLQPDLGTALVLGAVVAVADAAVKAWLHPAQSPQR